MSKSPYNASPQPKVLVDDEYCRLAINWDCDTNPSDPKDWHVTLHHSTQNDYREKEHYHIGLDQEQAKQLYKWLGKFLEKTNVSST